MIDQFAAIEKAANAYTNVSGSRASRIRMGGAALRSLAEQAAAEFRFFDGTHVGRLMIERDDTIPPGEAIIDHTTLADDMTQ